MHKVQAHTETESVYVNTEIARVLLRDDTSRELASTRSAIAEAAYYLSDPIEPDERERLLVAAETLGQGCSGEAREERAADALGVLSEAAEEIEELLRGPGENSEIRIARKAMFRAIADLARYMGIATNRVSAGTLRPARLGTRRRSRPAPQ